MNIIIIHMFYYLYNYNYHCEPHVILGVCRKGNSESESYALYQLKETWSTVHNVCICFSWEVYAGSLWKRTIPRSHYSTSKTVIGCVCMNIYDNMKWYDLIWSFMITLLIYTIPKQLWLYFIHMVTLLSGVIFFNDKILGYTSTSPSNSLLKDVPLCTTYLTSLCTIERQPYSPQPDFGHIMLNMVCGCGGVGGCSALSKNQMPLL